MRGKALLLIIIALLLLLGVFSCSPRVHVDRDETADLTIFKSYKFVDGGSDTIVAKDSNPLYKSSLLDKAIHDEIAQQLESRGLTKKSKSPDMLVAYHTFTQEKMGSRNDHYPMMYGGWGWQYYPGGLSPYPYGFWNGYNDNAYQYTEGTLIIDVINPKTKLLVWRGSITDAVGDPGDLHRKATNGVKQIFKKFPTKKI